MSNLAIRTALQTRLEALLPALDTVYENEPYTPKPDVAYQRATVMPADPSTPEMSRRLVIEMGLFHIMLCYPKDEGVGAIGLRIAALKAQFQRGLALVSGGVTVTIQGAPGVGQGRNSDTHFETPVRITYHANIVNP